MASWTKLLQNTEHSPATQFITAPGENAGPELRKKPKKPKQSELKQTAFRWKPEQDERLNKFCEQKGFYKGDVISAAVEAYLNANGG